VVYLLKGQGGKGGSVRADRCLRQLVISISPPIIRTAGKQERRGVGQKSRFGRHRGVQGAWGSQSKSRAEKNQTLRAAEGIREWCKRNGKDKASGRNTCIRGTIGAGARGVHHTKKGDRDSRKKPWRIEFLWATYTKNREKGVEDEVPKGG